MFQVQRSRFNVAGSTFSEWARSLKLCRVPRINMFRAKSNIER